MARLTKPELRARAAYDALAERHRALERHAQRLRHDLQTAAMIGNADEYRLLQDAVNAASGELAAMVPKLQAAMRDIERAKPAYLLDAPARPCVVITKPRAPVVDLTGRGRSFDAAGRERSPWHVRDAAEWRAICKSITPR